MDAELEFKVEFLENQIRELQLSLEKVREQRDNLNDSCNSLMHELEVAKTDIKLKQSVIDRLRLHIQQGVEL
jgi:peptidoglycan hydrolase CwlO-like protein